MGAKLGQNFLVDPNILRKILAWTMPQPTQVVVEVGCGDGVLTKALVDLVKQLYVIEIDATCIARTKQVLTESQCPVFIHGDVLEVGFSQLPPGASFRIIANIPYYISAKFIGLCADHKSHMTDATVMLQWEFAKKLVSKPGEEGYTPLAIFAQMHFEIVLAFQVSRHCFRPAPKVDSAIVTLRPKPLPTSLRDTDPGRFFTFVKAVFWGRRKPLKSSLHKSPYWDTTSAYATHPIWERLGQTRAETLSPMALLEVYLEIRDTLVLRL